VVERDGTQVEPARPAEFDGRWIEVDARRIPSAISGGFDDKAGAAGATGVGEEIWRINGSFLIVEAMRAGRAPQEACEVAVRRINEVAVRRGVHPAQAAFIALDPKGRYGAAATQGSNFQYATLTNGKVEVVKARELGVKD